MEPLTREQQEELVEFMRGLTKAKKASFAAEMEEDPSGFYTSNFDDALALGQSLADHHTAVAAEAVLVRLGLS